MVRKGTTYLILIVGAVVMILPFLWMVTTSLKSPNEALRFPPSLIPEELRFTNYFDAFRQVDFLRYFLNTLFMTSMTTLGVYVTSVLAAYAFARLRFAGRETIFILFLAVMMVPMPVYLVPSYIILNALRWLDTFLALIVPWSVNVFSIFLLRQHFRTLPGDLFDAAKLDGRSHLQTIWYIVLPLSKPVLITVGIFNVVASWNAFLWPLIVTHSDSMRTIQTGLAYFAQEASANYPLLMAASTCTILPLVVLYFLTQRYIIESYVRAGLKE